MNISMNNKMNGILIKSLRAAPAFIFAFLILLLPVLAAEASGSGAGRTASGGGGGSAAGPGDSTVLSFYIEDNALLLTVEQQFRLEEQAKDMSERYGCEVRVITVADMRSYGYNDIEGLSYYFYDGYDIGYGPDRSCLLLILSMAGRDYDLRAWGYGTTAFTYYGIDTLLDSHVLPLLGKNDFYAAFSAYLNTADEYLQMAATGKPFDRGTDPAVLRRTFFGKLAVTVILPLLIALVVCMIWRNQMKTAKIARMADNYIPDGGFRLTGHGDIYLYRTVTRTKVQQASSSSIGRAGAGSGGSSGRSGKF